MSANLISAVHDLVLESGLGAKNIAAAVGKPYSTLLREVNPFDDGAYLGAEPGRIGTLRIVDDPRSLRIGNLHEADIDRRGDLDGRERRQPLAALPSGRVGSRRDRRGNGSSRHRPAHRIGGGKPRCAGRDTDGNPCQKGRQNQSLHLFFHGPKS